MKKTFYILGSVLMIIFILKAGKFLFAPLLLALFIVILISPIENFLVRKRVPRMLSVFIAFILFFASITAVVGVIGSRYYIMIEQMPAFDNKIDGGITKLTSYVAEITGMERATVLEYANDIILKIKSSGKEYAGTVLNSVTGTISFMLFLPIFTLLILMYKTNISDFVISASKHNDRDTQEWKNSVNEIKTLVRKYILGLLFVTLILAVLNTIGLLILGIQFAIVIGASSAVLAVIPYLGNFLGGGLAILMAFATKDSAFYPIAVFLLYVFIQFLEGNIITPKIMGDQIGVNPLVVIIALLLGGAIWGLIGMIVSIPLVAILKLLFDKKDELHPLSELMKGSD